MASLRNWKTRKPYATDATCFKWTHSSSYQRDRIPYAGRLTVVIELPNADSGAFRYSIVSGAALYTGNVAICDNDMPGP